VVVVLTAAIAFFVGFALLVLPSVVRQASKLGEEVPQTLERLDEIPVIGPVLAENDVPDRIRTWVDELPRRLALDSSPLETAGRSIIEGVLFASLMLVVGVTMLLDGDRLVGGVRKLVPPERREFADRLGRLAYVALGRYMAGSIFVALVAGVYVFTVSTILGLPLAPLAGIWVAMTNLIPQIGGALGGVPFVLLGFTQSPTKGVICVVAFLVYQQLENNLVHPIIVGKTVRLSAAATTIGALVGASTAGVVGALVAVPLMGVIKTFYLDLRFPDADGALREESPPGPIRRFLDRFRRPARR
jgi:predicted PurR-regulated permease PerM